MSTKSLVRPLALAGIGVLGLAACTAEGSQQSEQKEGAQDAIQVVTPTNVYAEIVEQIGGDQVEATPIITSTAQDPHSYEASPADRLTVEDADLVIVNGGGYDAFLAEMAEAGDAPVINVVEASTHEGHSHEGDSHEAHSEAAHSEEAQAEEGSHAHETHSHETQTEGSSHDSHDHGDHAEQSGHDHESHAHEGHDHDHALFNEHLWYDLHAMSHLSDAIEEKLTELDTKHAEEFSQRAGDFEDKLAALEEQAAKVDGEGKSYLATEAVSAPLLNATGLENRTPSGYVAAIEHGNDAPVTAVYETQSLIGSGEIDLLAVNPQTATAQTEQLVEEAKKHQVPTVEYTETIPEGEDYLSWMKNNIQRTADALSR